MKKLPLVLLLTCSAMLVGCNNGQKINGHTEKTAYRSIKMIKPRLQEEMRVEYEMSFWMIRDEKKDNAEFLKTVDEKTPAEIVAMGKEIYQKRKTEGVPEYQTYKSWEEMMAKYDRDRMAQGKAKSDIKEKIIDPQSGNRDVIYHM
ncbi:MAG: hypothetical protein WBI40_06225 [Methylococcaceae bacterium]